MTGALSGRSPKQIAVSMAGSRFEEWLSSYRCLQRETRCVRIETQHSSIKEAYNDDLPVTRNRGKVTEYFCSIPEISTRRKYLKPNYIHTIFIFHSPGHLSHHSVYPRCLLLNLQVWVTKKQNTVQFSGWKNAKLTIQGST